MLYLFETLRKKNHLVPNHLGTLFFVQILKTNLGRKQMRSKTAAIRRVQCIGKYAINPCKIYLQNCNPCAKLEYGRDVLGSKTSCVPTTFQLLT